MPFETRDGRPLTSLPLVYRGGREFQVIEEFQYRNPRDGSVTVVATHDTDARPGGGNSTDFASVPPFMWGIIANYGTQTLPAILHDGLIGQLLREPRERHLELRRAADDLFRVALIDNGVHHLRAQVMWGSVGLERHARHDGIRGWLLIANGVVGVALIVAAVILSVLLHPGWLALAFLPAVMALGWGRDASLVLAASYIGAMYLPFVIGAFVASHAENLLAIAVWLLSGCRGPRPRAEPTIVWQEEYAPETAAPHPPTR